MRGFGGGRQAIAVIFFATAWGWFPREHLVGGGVRFVSGFDCGRYDSKTNKATTKRKSLERSEGG